MLAWGLIRLRHPPCGVERPSVTVVIPMHNEESCAEETLRALHLQDYQGAWELVCVDDRSDDDTARIVQDWSRKDPRIRLVQVERSEPAVPSPKKRALARGLDSATGVILITTDADCQPPPHWISSLVSCFAGEVDLVQGPKHCLGDGRAVHRYQRLEMLAFVAAEAAGFALGKPFLASAPSLAYRASVYRRCGGFHGLEGLVSGDDDMLVHRMVAAGARPAYALDPSISVPTHPANSWRQALNQRARWASNGSRYENPFYVALLVGVFLWWCWLLLGWIPWLLELVPGALWWGVWLAKTPFDLLFLAVGAHRFRRWKTLWDYPWCLPLQVGIFVYSAVAGHLGWFRWTREADGG
ncbi:MAG TPA: glycosyltransferase [Fibrobacteria bacterium]|nr:glycosyltransferase [Fibrobacteria bacterium]